VSVALVGCGARTPLDLPAIEATAQRISPVADLAVGARHVCARREDGGVLCWGEGARGQLGTGATTKTPLPTPVARLSTVAGISAGGLHTCAWLRDGSARCWGDRSLGQLGDGVDLVGGTPPIVAQPSAVLGLSAVSGLAAGGGFTCALVGGAVSCFGSNDFGELGDGRAERSSRVRSVIGIEEARGLAVGAAHACVVDAGRVKCWGSNDGGQLGPRSDDRCGSIDCTRTPVDLGFSGATKLALGADRSCALREDGTVWCWGNSGGTKVYLPRQVPGLAGIVDLALGRAHSCAKTADRALLCWGEGTRGQLGRPVADPCPRGTGQCDPRPTAVPILGAVEKVAAGGDTTCVLLAAGGVRCFGANDAGQLGDGSTEDRSVPVAPLLPELTVEAAEAAR
jgi:alpha-tubulin suppressor-like RCC1 family protein